MPTAKKSPEIKSVMIKMPMPLYNRIVKAAEAEYRTTPAQISMILDKWLKDQSA